MSNLNILPKQTKSLRENLPLEGNQKSKLKHSHSGSNAEILTAGGIESVYLNRRLAIKSKCLDCSGFEFAEMRNCHHKDCSLWQFRTGKGPQNPVNRDKAIKAYCMWCTLDQSHEITNCTSVNCPLFIFRGYTLPEKNALDKDTSSKSTTGELPDDLSFKVDSKIPEEEIKL